VPSGFRIAKHCFEVVLAPPLRVIHDVGSVEARVYIGGDEARKMPHRVVRCTNEKVDELVLMFRWNRKTLTNVIMGASTLMVLMLVSYGAYQERPSDGPRRAASRRSAITRLRE